MNSSTRSLDVLLRQVQDPALRAELRNAVDLLRKQTEFGLVFEGHQPEISRLNGLSVRAGSVVVRKSDSGSKQLRVTSVTNGVAACLPADPAQSNDAKVEAIPTKDLVVCRRFGDPVFPSLTIKETLRKGDGPWHLLIEADNYHALQLLQYTHRGAVDVIYIDPPYNTGARDWKYNNDYVDRADPWRHSKWLSFMEKRLTLASTLLKPNGVLVVTIDEHEVHHLSCLLEQTFRDAYQQMVTIVINPAGVTQGRFSRVEEHAIFTFRGTAKVDVGVDDYLTPFDISGPGTTAPSWESLLRRGTGAKRSDRKSMFYPVIVDPSRGSVVGVGDALPYEEQPDFDLKINGMPVAWPVRTDLTLGRWKVGSDSLKKLIGDGFVRLGRFDPKRRTWGLTYATRKIHQQITSGEIKVTGRDERTGVVELVYATDRTRPPRTVWNRSRHNAGPNGTDFLRDVFGEGERFSFPKSIYSVRDTLSTLVRENPEAVVLDFFGGSGTTFNAIALLNAADGGHRQAIVVTNNEVSESDSKALTHAGLAPGDIKWEEKGICRNVTWPRVKFVTQGHRDDGTPLPGEYLTGNYEENLRPPTVSQLNFDGSSLGTKQRRDLVRLMPRLSMSEVTADAFLISEKAGVSVLWDVDSATTWLEQLEVAEGIADIYVLTTDNRLYRTIAEQVSILANPVATVEEVRRPLSDGFSENVAYLTMGFLDPDDVASGTKLPDLIPAIWIAAGCKGECPSLDKNKPWIVSPENGLAVLLREGDFQDFRVALTEDIARVYLITDSRDVFREMLAQLPNGLSVSMLYSEYLREFRLNAFGGQS